MSLFVEGGLRLREGREPANDWDTVTWGHKVTNNKLGFREREFAIPKPDGLYRVMVLGDSLTWGEGLPVEERYTDVLQRRLGAGDSVEILNFGVDGYPTTKERDLLYEYIDAVEPDLVVVGFCSNDPKPQSVDASAERDHYEPLFRALEAWDGTLYEATGRFLRRKVDRVLQRIGWIPTWQDALDRSYDPESNDWKTFVGALSDIVSACKSRGLPAPVFAPLLYESGDYSLPSPDLVYHLRWSSRAAKAAADAGMQVVDMTEAFAAEGYRERQVNPWDAHPDAQCNILYANALEGPILRHVRAARPTPTASDPDTGR